MNQPLQLCNGAFSAELVKGKWEYTPNYKKMAKKKPLEGSEKERPQYSFVEKVEKEVSNKYRKTINNTVIDIVKFLKTIGDLH